MQPVGCPILLVNHFQRNLPISRFSDAEVLKTELSNALY